MSPPLTPSRSERTTRPLEVSAIIDILAAKPRDGKPELNNGRIAAKLSRWKDFDRKIEAYYKQREEQKSVVAA